jgi:NAD(P)H-hydrate epimerase
MPSTRIPPDLPASWPPAYPPHRPRSRAQANDLDRRATAEFGIPSLVLMEHASQGIACLAELLAGPEGTVLALCGPGNNGGDGYGAARFLRSWGRPVEVLRCAPRAPAGGDAGLQAGLVAAMGPVRDAWSAPEAVQEALERGPEVVLDALLGVNFDAARGLSEPFLGWVRALNGAPVLRLAVDVPSGLDADTGQSAPLCVHAHVTAAMAAPKAGFSSAPQACGRVVEIDIGLPRGLHGAFLA